MHLSLSDHPHILDRILSHAAWSTLPTVRQTTKEVAAYANAVLYRHVVVNVRGTALELLDPFRMQRVPGLRLEPRHPDYKLTLQRLAAHTSTFDFVAIGVMTLENLGSTEAWDDIRPIAEKKRIRSSQPITYLLDTPQDVILHHAVDFTPRGRRELVRTEIRRLIIRIDVSELHTRPFPQVNGLTAVTPMGDFTTGAGYLLRADEIIFLFTQGDGRPIPGWHEFVDDPDSQPPRPIDMLLSLGFSPLDPHPVTIAGLESIDPRILYVEPSAADTKESRLMRLHQALIPFIARGVTVTSHCEIQYDTGARVNLFLVTLDDFRHSAGLDDEYDWRVIMSKPGVKLPFPATWNVTKHL
ncbi:uncharacterized protein LOC62_07G008960 [Vanrija pseudolonga]|uniref:Uncharacterized protein n=1 Tax=Vanrija pseudolonga TaxID=143232 RepID=A0AAF0YIV7_9TREE|nr:hypothetical protein LOC62_07G008960 [Vanrija pseudolonga]